MYRSPDPEDVCVGDKYRMWLEPGVAVTLTVTRADCDRDVFSGYDFTGRVWTFCADDLEVK